MATANLSAGRLRQLFSYDETDGLFRQRGDRTGAWKAGRIAGAKDASGYVRISVDGAYYRAHRLAWLYVTGVWPAGALDHIDGDRSNNRVSNLREASVRMNTENTRVARSTSVVGLLGVSKTATGRYTAIIRTTLAGHTVQLYLGSYDTAADAHAVYMDAKKRLHTGFAHRAGLKES